MPQPGVPKTNSTSLGIDLRQRNKTVAILYVEDVQKTCQRLREAFPPEKRPDLAFCDPPFNLGKEYDGYDDDLEENQYLTWTCEWMTELFHSLHPNASFYLSISNRLQAKLRCLAESVGFVWRDTLCWHYTFGPHQKGQLTPSWVPIHYFVKRKERFTWNREEILVPSQRQLKYKDKRANSEGKTPDNVWILSPREEGLFREDQNAILSSRICGTFKDRTTHPCQMPVSVLDRIIRLSSNPGDLVFDPFLGSGTTGVAALAVRRRFVGCDQSAEYVHQVALPRLQALLNGREAF